MYLTFGINKFPGCIIFLFYPLKCCLFKLYNSNILFVGRIIEFDSLQHFLTFVRKKKWYTHEKEEEWRGNPRSTALTFGSFSGVMAYTRVTSTPSSPAAS